MARTSTSTSPAEKQPPAPSVSLPKGGGAVRGIGEKFAANPATGTGRMSVPIATSPAPSALGPGLGLSYDSGAGNGPFGVGWQLTVPAITRKTETGLPRYRDAMDSDIFLLSGTDDLVPAPEENGLVTSAVAGYTVRRYRPRTDDESSRIERWTRDSDGDTHWRALSADNVLSVYGRDAESRIADPTDPHRIFSWLLCEIRDDRGNGVLYRYKREDAAGVDVTLPHERQRGGPDSPARTAGRYLKSVRYGNQVPLLDATGQRPVDVAPQALRDAGWMFEAVLDYGEHSAGSPGTAEDGTWLCRNDPFSSHRSGFEVRGYRLCQRVLMFHHFPDEPGVGADCLVRSTEFAYRDAPDAQGVPGDRRHGHPVGSFIESVTGVGHLRAAEGGYSRAPLPPVTFEYSRAEISSAVRRLEPGSLDNLPAGLGESSGQWVDLDGEGLSGMLTSQGGSWFYKPNLGDGRLGPLRRLATRPAAELGRQRLLDLSGDGRLDLVHLDTSPAGFYERDDEDGWDTFVPLAAVPNVDWDTGSSQLMDLTGDGLADLLTCEDTSVTWYPSLGSTGFGPPLHSALPQDEHGPRPLVADSTQSVFLADMSGDGLTDLVRIRNGQVCYWPNTGYGRFGAQITMSGSPVFDRPDRFDPANLRLADVDGSGTVDLLYLGTGDVRLWFNQSGNGWSPPRLLPDFPHLDDRTAVTTADLLGNGTACLVWSSPLPADAGDPLRYVDLMGGTKPDLLVRSVNNLGAETRVRYAASTKFAVADRRAGRPWITRLPFPVHVVEQVEHLDHISRTRFTTEYSYHHGHYDGHEREFRGFAMVEQRDTEAYEGYAAGVARSGGAQDTTPALYQPPVTVRSWFHTGAYPDGGHLLDRLRQEFYLRQSHLPDPELPQGLDPRELREGVRALKGLPLRTEVYSFDGSPDERHPYSVTESTYALRRLQPSAGEHPAVFLIQPLESMTRDYDRDPTDPRVGHTLALEHGPHGTVLKSASVTYGRRVPDAALPVEVSRDQQRTYVTCTESDYTPDLDRPGPVPVHRLGVVHETRGYEVTGLVPAAAAFTARELREGIANAAPLAYEDVADGVSAQKRVLSRECTLFRDNGLAVLPPGQWDTLGLGYETYRLAFTPSVTAAHYAGQVTDADFTAAGYVHSSGDANWWIPSGTAVYPPDPAARFYRPAGTRDPFGVETLADLDRYGLLVERVRVTQAAWNVVRAVNDYRVLGPVRVTDANGNRSAVEFDALGLVVRTALLGKAGAGEGDTLADPTTRLEYELFNWMDHGRPNRTHTFAREQHGAADTRWRESYAYADGSGGVAMTKAQAAPGDALVGHADGTTGTVHADRRWIGSGRTVLNNKGLPVKRYEPFFSPTHEYEAEEAMRAIGSTAVLSYDPVGRIVRTDLPDGTFTKTVFRQWSQETWDANDTVLSSRWYTDRGSPDSLTEAEPADPDRRAAWLAARHAGTPAVVHLDSLGRPVHSVADYGGGVTAAVRSRTDLTGRLTRILDQFERMAAGGFTGMAGSPVFAESAERGRRWTFSDVRGGLVRTWDDQGRVFRAEYDSLRRPVSGFVRDGEQPEVLYEHTIHGDRHPEAAARNLLGSVHQTFDPSGSVRILRADFKGNALQVERLLARDYTRVPDWSGPAAQQDYAAVQTAAAPALETGEPFVAASLHDALNRPVQVTLPDGTLIAPVYDLSGLAASISARIQGQGPWVEFLKEQAYDARGQRQYARHGNDALVRYFYDPHTFRLVNLLTTAAGGSVQDLRFTYDATGNVTQVRDGAQQTRFFANAVVEAQTRYEYDALYQLVRASGREHAGTANDTVRDHGDLAPVLQLPHANDATAVRTYTETYGYDVLGNLKQLKHAATGGNWTRHYRYAYEDDPANATNRLTATSRPGDPETGPYTATYDYDTYGNMTRLRTADPDAMVWDVFDRLHRADLGGGGTAYYTYGTGGQRTRKVVEHLGGERTERIYLGVLEILRVRQGTAEPHLERHTLHLSDNAGRVAQVDVKIRDDRGSDPGNPLGVPLVRYQYSNHLGSATLETDDTGTVISYEEYHPFGTTAYRSGKPGTDLSLKRYRFSGKERDDETGLYYFGARYYAAWLGRWTSPDPAGLVSGLNLYVYCSNSPGCRVDPNGMDDHPTCMLTVGEGGFVPKDLEPGGCFAAARDGRLGADAGALPSFSYRPPSHAPASPAHSGRPAHRPSPRHAPAAPSSPGPAATPPPAAASDPGGGAEPGAAPDLPPLPEPPSPPGGGSAPGAAGAGASLAGPAAERFIWNYDFPGTGVYGTQRGRILEWMYGVPWRDTTPRIDHITDTAIQQIRSTEVNRMGDVARTAVRSADRYINANPAAAGTRRPQAVVITRTDVSARQADDIATSMQRINNRRIPATALDTEHVRGLPKNWGRAGTGLTVVGTGLSAYSLYHDYEQGDWAMGAGDALSTAGGGLELYALGSAGATVAGVSAMSAGLVLGGAGIAVASGVSGVRAYQAGDTAGVVAGAVGVAAGIAIVAGVVFGAPVLLAAGAIAALAVGLFHFGRWLASP